MTITITNQDVIDFFVNNISKEVEELELPNYFLGDMTILGNFPNLKKLTIRGYCKASPEEIDYIKNNTQITEIITSNGSIVPYDYIPKKDEIYLTSPLPVLISGNLICRANNNLFQNDTVEAVISDDEVDLDLLKRAYENSIKPNKKITSVTIMSEALTEEKTYHRALLDMKIDEEGSIDAMIESIIKSPELTTDQKKYLRYEIEYIDGTSINDSQLLKSGETKTISILFSYRNDIPTTDLPNSETDFDLEIVLVYVQANATGTEISGKEKFVKVVSGDLNTVGSEICIDTECFYLINNDGYSVTMFAKYNLYVGGVYDYNASSWTAYGEESTGIQNENMRGYMGENVRKGTLTFSYTTYWSDDSTLKPEYGNNYPAYVYDSNSKTYIHIQNYKNYLQQFNLIVEEARLIKIEELEKLGCSISERTCNSSSHSWTYSTTYWTGNANTNAKIWRVDTRKLFWEVDYDDDWSFGIRPVIEIPLTEF